MVRLFQVLYLLGIDNLGLVISFKFEIPWLVADEHEAGAAGGVLQEQGDGDQLNYIRQWATSDGFSTGLKWVALVSTGLVVLIDVALLVGVLQGKVLAQGEVVVAGDGSGDAGDEGMKKEQWLKLKWFISVS